MSEGEKDKKAIEPTLEPSCRPISANNCATCSAPWRENLCRTDFGNLLDRLEAGEQPSPAASPEADDEADSPMNETTRPRLKDLLLAEIPSLRAFALSLSGNSDRADDLVQDTLMKAWANAASFMEGTNMRAWLFTIMRNTFFSQYRKARREVQDVDGEAASRLVAMPDQLAHLDFTDFKAISTACPPTSARLWC